MGNESCKSPSWTNGRNGETPLPQTLLTYEMNGGELPVGFGGPLRMRISRQLGYKSLKYVTQLTLTDNIKQFGKGLGSAEPEGGYAWYADA